MEKIQCEVSSLSLSLSTQFPPPRASVTTDFRFLCTLPASLYVSRSKYKDKGLFTPAPSFHTTLLSMHLESLAAPSVEFTQSVCGP